MDIIITDSSLRQFLDTPADSETISQNVSLCGPTFDRLKKIKHDVVYEIEAITNRVDTASAQGVAREAAIILNQFNIPAKLVNDPYKQKLNFQDGLPKQFHFIFSDNLATRFTAITLEKINLQPSPEATQEFLTNCGQHAINNCVDITNELTILYGLPSHVFDLDKLASQSLHVRESKNGEQIITLDGQNHSLLGGEIVIEDGSHRLVDLCGIMGGQVAVVDEHTKNILLIVPVYNPKKIRQASISHQKRTLAAQLYEKQPDPELCLPVVQKAIQLFKERAGAEVSSSLLDYYPNQRPTKTLSLNLDWLNSFIGVEIKMDTVITILDNLGFSGTASEGNLLCTIPSWRYHDIAIKEDLAEEVARIYGYFRLPAVLPNVNLSVEPESTLLKSELKTKRYLSHLGFHEIYNSSLVSLLLLDKSSQDSTKNLKLRNSLSQDFEYLRTTLTPSLLENYKNNQGKFHGPINLFEISNTYQPTKDHKLPQEVSKLAILSSSTFHEIKGLVESILDYLKVKNVSFKTSQKTFPFLNTVRTADIYSEKLFLGNIGQVQTSVLRSFGIQSNLTAIEIDFKPLSAQISPITIYEAISEFPLINEDITISSGKSIGDIINIIFQTTKLIKDIEYLNSFQTKHTFRVSFGSQKKNLDKKEINSLKEIIQSRFS